MMSSISSWSVAIDLYSVFVSVAFQLVNLLEMTLEKPVFLSTRIFKIVHGSYFSLHSAANQFDDGFSVFPYTLIL